MFNFTDFIAFMVIEEMMEEEEKKDLSYGESSYKPPNSKAKRKPLTPGCFIIIGFFIIALVFTFIGESLWILIGGSVLGLFVGLLYDTYQAAWGKKSYSRKQTDKKEESV